MLFQKPEFSRSLLYDISPDFSLQETKVFYLTAFKLISRLLI